MTQTTIKKEKEPLKGHCINSLLNAIPTGIAVKEGTKITEWNDSLERITGYSKEEVKGKTCKHILGTEYCDTDCPLMNKHKPALRREVAITCKDGSKKYVLKSCQKVPHKNKVITSVEETTDYHLLKEYLKEKVEERTQELNQVNLKVLSLLEQKRMFISQIGHDLKTPLTLAIGSAQILGLTQKDNEQVAQKTGKIIKNLTQINELLEDVLTLSQLDCNAFTLRKKKGNLSLLLKDILNLHEEEFEKKGIQIQKNIKQTKDFEFDTIKMTEVFQNIISNALKYMNKKKQKLTLLIQPNQKEKVITIRISDNGIGMNKETLKHVFTEFYREDPSRHESSAGLGLTISKQIIEYHGGKIWAESEGKNKGSTIAFTIPYEELELSKNKNKAKIQ